MRLRDPSLKFEIVSCIPRRKKSAYEVDMKYGRQIPIQFFVVIPGGRRKILTSNWTVDPAVITNVPDNTHRE